MVHDVHPTIHQGLSTEHLHISFTCHTSANCHFDQYSYHHHLPRTPPHTALPVQHLRHITTGLALRSTVYPSLLRQSRNFPVNTTHITPNHDYVIAAENFGRSDATHSPRNATHSTPRHSSAPFHHLRTIRRHLLKRKTTCYLLNVCPISTHDRETTSHYLQTR